MQKLWSYSNTKSRLEVVEHFLCKKDVMLDNIFLKYDIQGTLAHIKVLHHTGIVTKKEFHRLNSVLKALLKKVEKGKVKVCHIDEDSHTFIEKYVTKKLGNLGKKIHTARSRNDQVLTMIRLYLKDKFSWIVDSIDVLKKVYLDLSVKYKEIIIPGYSHYQKAMPLTLGIYFKSFRDELIDDMKLFTFVMKIIDQSPLGSGAGFGLPFDWPRDIAARELGFSRVQNNPVYCQSSRIKFEQMFVFCIEILARTIARFASDMLLFTMQEFQFFSLPEEFTTGSSLMPNKRNYDIFEIMRASYTTIKSACQEIGMYGFNLISGYHRDFQCSKEPLTRAVESILTLIEINTLVLKNLKVNKENLTKAITDDMFATLEVLRLAKRGIPFRDAYRKVKKNLLKVVRKTKHRR